nr:uncharacterized protein LOC107441389 isoform X2 [Parasteatoda tepidariorum]
MLEQEYFLLQRQRILQLLKRLKRQFQLLVMVGFKIAGYRVELQESALFNAGNENKGASVSAIVTWILSNYSIMDPNQLKIQVKKSVIKLLEKGDLQRSWTSKGALGSSGSFVLPKERVKKTNYMNSNSRAQMKKSITLKANTIRESKKFPKIRESGIKADKFSVSEFQKLLEKQT